jgi:hypothetical protein
VKGFIVVDVDLSIEVVVGDGGNRCGCVRGSSRLRRHVWGGRNEDSFPKDMTGKSCFYNQEMKRKENQK